MKVKTLVIGNVAKDGKIEQNSYFSRLCEYSDFAQRAQVEVKRRNLKQAQQVVAVHDEADWVIPVISACLPDALRILDF